MHLRPKRRTLRTALAVVATAATVAGLSVAGVSSAEAAGRVTFAGSVPSWAKAANVVAAATPAPILQGEIFFDLQTATTGTWAGQTAEAAAKAISTPGNAAYRQYLSPSEWISTFAPGVDGAPVTKMETFLTQEGVKASTIQVPTSGLYIVFRGTQAQITNAFGAKLLSYNVNGTTIVAPSTAPSLPADVAAGVSGIVLDQSRFQTRPLSLSQAQAATKAAASLQSLSETLLAPKAVTVKTPCSTYTNQVMVKVPTAYHNSKVGTANCGYTPAQLRAAYKVTAGTSAGSGQTVAIVDAYDAPTTALDSTTLSRKAGEPTLTTNQYQDVTPAQSTWTDEAACGEPSGWQGEQAMDVEAVHAIAPAATILYAGASDCAAGTDLAVSRILDGNATSGQEAGSTPLANIVSNSYGGVGEPSTSAVDTNYTQGEVNIELQAAAEGVGLYFASGDDGDNKADVGTAEPDFPASSPWVTAVGGTSLGLSKTNTKIFETGWGDVGDQIVAGAHATLRYAETLPGTLWGGGSGGGKSSLFKRGAAAGAAWYQTSPVVPGSLGAGRRLVPDVAALADPFTGMLVGLRPIYNNTTLANSTYQTSVGGGTSLATPLFAAQMAVAQQQTGATIGFANPALYSLAATTPSSFVDVVTRAVPAALAYSGSTQSYLITLGKDESLTTAKGYDTVTGLGDFDLAAAAGLATPAAAN
ncbi:MAG: hypothetical protein JWP75_2331 [Frondihabitans sp.]|nr:hypothetical protein [Frondihabitans sp.]